MSVMSSDVSGELFVPPDSPGSSVSTTLQEEYDELLKYAVVLPAGAKTLPTPGQAFPLFRQIIDAQDNLESNDGRGFEGDDEQDRTIEASTSDVSQVNGMQENGEFGIDHNQASSSTPRDSPTQGMHNTESKHRRYFGADTIQPGVSQSEQRLHNKDGGGSSGYPHRVDQSVHDQHPPRHFQTSMRRVSHDDSVASSRYVEESQMVYTSGVDPDITRMESLLDQWTLDLKRNVLAEFGQSKIKTIEHHKQEMLRLRERHNTERNQLQNEMESMKELLHTYEKSMERKDQVISNLTGGIQKQKEKLEMLRTFCEWKMSHTESRKEAFAMNLARKQHERCVLRRAWCAWHGVIENKWRMRVEKACQAKAQQVCLELTNEYETKIAELSGALAAARDEVASLSVQREQYEESMKKAFMRGVCALNMEAMSIFSEDDRSASTARDSARDTDNDVISSHAPAASSHGHSTAQGAAYYTHTGQGIRETHSEHNHSNGPHVIVGSQPPAVRLPQSQSVPTQSKSITTGNTRKGKGVTSRVTAKVDTGRGKSSSGPPPPSNSVVVERHPPINKHAMGQTTASQYPAKPGSGQGQPQGRSKNGVHVTAPHLHTIKVVE